MFGLCEMDERKCGTLTIAIVDADYHKQIEIAGQSIPVDSNANESVRIQFFRKRRSVVQDSLCAEHLIKICNSSWRGRERMSMGDRRRKKMLDIETLLSCH
ncbi:unnamed protein product [Toxocara canis]|nr:unnamed protein product [Toxocara canis]